MPREEREVLRVFVSHRHDDERVCDEIVQKLRNYAAGKIEFMFSPEIKDGEQWFKWITDKAPTADIFLFIYTRPDRRWDWPLFEAGLFEAARIAKTNSHSFVCLHAPDVEIPEPLKALQARPATVDHVAKWLRELFGTTWPDMSEPINPDFANSPLLQKEAQEISDAIIEKSASEPRIEARLARAHCLDPDQRILRSGLRLGFFFRWCIAEEKIGRLETWASDDDRFRKEASELARDISWVHSEGEKSGLDLLNVLKRTLTKIQYKQILVVYNRWRCHSDTLLILIERDREDERHRDEIIETLKKLLNLNKFFMAVFASALTKIAQREKPRFEDISDGIKIDEQPDVKLSPAAVAKANSSNSAADTVNVSIVP